MGRDQTLRQAVWLTCFFPHLQYSSQRGFSRQERFTEKHLQGKSSVVSARNVALGCSGELYICLQPSVWTFNPEGKCLASVPLPVSFTWTPPMAPAATSHTAVSHWACHSPITVTGKVAFYPVQGSLRFVPQLCCLSFE